MPQPVNGPSVRCATSTAQPIGIGARAETVEPPMSFSSGLPLHTATLKTTKMSSSVPMNSSAKPPAGFVSGASAMPDA